MDQFPVLEIEMACAIQKLKLFLQGKVKDDDLRAMNEKLNF